MTREYSFKGKAITVQEPWASAIAYAGKTIENRSVRTHYRGPIAIHSSVASSVRKDGLECETRIVRGGEKKPLGEWIRKGRLSFGREADAPLIEPGMILAIAMLVDCIERSGSPWFGGPFGYVFEGIIPIEPIAQKGALGLWNVQFKYQPVR